MSNGLDLIKIHKRRIEIETAAEAEMGDHFPAHRTIQLDRDKDAIKSLEFELSRRLQKLRLKMATMGLSADPSIEIEIEDIENYFNLDKPSRVDYI